MADEQSKIIIDEDWKSQVQREKLQAAQPSEEEQEDAAPEAVSYTHLRAHET